MKVNLKKAAALAAAVSAVGAKFDHAYNVDLYADPPNEEAVTRAREALGSQVATALTLAEVVFVIRQLIGEANVPRVNSLLTKRALIDKQLSIINSVPVRRQGTNLTALARQIEALRVGENKAYGVKAPNLELETETLVAPILRELRKAKRELDDELQAVNFNTTIELPDGVVQVLKDLDLI